MNKLFIALSVFVSTLLITQWSASPISLPTGTLLFSTSGTCPLGSSEATDIVNRVIVTTSIAGGLAGTTGGNDNITPTGTISAPTFTGTSSTVIVNHVHVQNVNTGATGGSNGYGRDTSTNGSEATAISTANPTGGSASYTPVGTNSVPTFTGNSFDNRPAFVKVVVCRVN